MNIVRSGMENIDSQITKIEMPKKPFRYWICFFKTLKWIIGNTVFGLFPLLFFCSIFYLTDKKFGGDQVDTLIYEGSILFVCIALVGAVLIDYYLSGLRPIGFTRFATYFFPVALLFVVTENYFLIHIGYVSKSRFALKSNTTIFVITITVIYIIFVKTELYIKEGFRHELV